MMAAWGEVVSVDVYEWSRLGTGTTIDGWEVYNIDDYSDKGARLDTKDDFVRSPVFSFCITQLVLTVRASSATTERFLTAIPLSAKSSATNLTARATTSYEEQVLVWPAEADVRQFQLQNLGSGPSGWGIRSCTLFFDRLPAPTQWPADTRYSDALTIAWQPDSRAVEYEYEVLGVQTIPASSTLLRMFDFSSLTNTVGNTRDFALLNPPDELSDVDGTELCLQAKAGGHLQVGKNKVVGTMSLPLPAATHRTALMTMFRHETDTDGDVSIGTICGAATNLTDSAILTLQPSETHLTLSDDATALFLQSRSGRRIRVVEVKIVADYVASSATTNAIDGDRLSVCSRQIKNLASGDYLWRVRSFDSENRASPWSAFASATLDATNPPRPIPGFLIFLR